MTRYLQIFGLSGAILTLFGAVAFFFTRNILDPYVLIHLGLGVVGLLVYLTTQGGALVGSLRRRSTRYGLHSVSYSLLFIGTLILLNFLNTRYNYRWDFTEAKLFSLSSQTTKVLAQLKQDLLIYGFFERGENPRVADLIKSYTYQSPKIKFYATDPDRHPEMAKQFKIQQTNTLHLIYGKESMNTTETNEEALTNAIVRLTKVSKKNVYVVTGHGEPSIEDRQNSQGYAAAKEALENENYQVKELLLSTQERVPVETSLLILAGPQKALLEHELNAIENYLQSGGRLLLLLPSPGGESLKGFLSNWGVVAGNDIVVDQVIRLFAGPSLGVEPIADTYSPSHPITRDFKERTIFPLVRSVGPANSTREGLEATPLVQTSPTSWAEKDLDGVFKKGRASLGPDDKKGPVSIGVAVTADLKKIGGDKEGDAKIVALGTAGFANNRFINIFFNRDFFLNIVNWLVGQEEMISIRPRSIRSSRLQLTEREGTTVFYLSFLILPEILLITGLAVWWRRR
ncbi:MAG: GldG family protein [Deltaproteobacteria bacterium]|nr:GldG family protein [Deltaproteobacteria bacterium]